MGTNTATLRGQGGPQNPDHETADLRVKGSSLISKLRFVQERFGDPAHEELQAVLARSGVHQILDGSWYPFGLYDELLRLIAERHYRSDLSKLQEVGIYSAESALGTTYEVYGLGDFFYFMERVSHLHCRFYSVGQLDCSVDREARRCRIRLHGAPYYCDPDLYVASGFYAGAARWLGLSGVTCSFEIVGSEVHFELTWEASG